MDAQNFTDGPLTLRLHDSGEAIRIDWLGRSTAREPAKFVLPILSKGLELGGQAGKPVVIDFQNLDYLNSSTLTPVIRILEQARRGSSKLTVLYRKDLKWQSLSFTALELFGTPDKRIEVRGV